MQTLAAMEPVTSVTLLAHSLTHSLAAGGSLTECGELASMR